MKKQVSHRHVSRAVALSKTDLDVIIEYFQVTSDSYRVSTESYSFDSIDEWRLHRDGRSRNLTIASYALGLNLDIRTKWIFFGVYFPVILTCYSEEGESSYFHIKDFLTKRRRAMPICNLIVLCAIFGYWGLASSGSDLKPSLIMMCFAYITLGPILYFGFPSAIELGLEQSEQTFWTRNSDKIILLLMGAAIGFFIKYLMG